MANVVRKAFRYLSKRADVAFEEKARPDIQLEQAMDEARRQHEKLTSQAAMVLGNQRHIEMKLGRQIEKVNQLTDEARSSLLLADSSRAAGKHPEADRYEQLAQALAGELITAEASLEELKVLQGQAAAAADQARTAVADNHLRLQRLNTERTRLLTQLEHVAMQEQMGKVMEGLSELPPAGDTPSLASVRDKIEKRAAHAYGRQELLSQGLAAQRIEVRRASVDAQALGRLAELRRSLGPAPGAPGGAGAPRPPIGPAVGSGFAGGTSDQPQSLEKGQGNSAPSHDGPDPTPAGP